MEARTCLKSAVTLTTAIVFASATINPGTYKAYPIGKERAAGSWEAGGLTVGTGFLDHTTWHCFGLSNIASGSEPWHGYCVVTDPSGDQILTNVASEK